VSRYGTQSGVEIELFFIKKGVTDIEAYCSRTTHFALDRGGIVLKHRGRLI